MEVDVRRRRLPELPHHHQVEMVVNPAKREGGEAIIWSVPSPCRSHERRYPAQLLGYPPQDDFGTVSKRSTM